MTLLDKILLGIAGTALIALFFIPASAKADELFVKDVINPVVQLERNCSGVVIDTPNLKQTIIVTANHCVSDDATPDPEEKSGYVFIDDKDGATVVTTTKYVYDVVVRDTGNDIALIKLRKEGLLLDSASLTSEDPKEGDDVWTVGYPLGQPRTVTQGFFGGFSSLNRDMTFNEFGNGRMVYKASPAIYGGNSGGGMFSKVKGEYKLVGITDAGFSSFFVVGFYNPQAPINELVAKGLKQIAGEVPVVKEDPRHN